MLVETRRYGSVPRNRLLPFAFALICGACAHRPDVPPGPEIVTRFGPPIDLAQREEVTELRHATVTFPTGEVQKTEEKTSSTTDETWKRMPDGTWRVTQTLVDERTVRDGVPMPSEFSVRGIELVQRVDADGKFLRAEEMEETLRLIRDRVGDRKTRFAFDAVITADALAKRLETAWKRRFEGVCGSQKPGDARFRVDVQGLPAGGPVLGVMRELVLGRGPDADETVALRLDVGGRDSDVAADAQHAGFFDEAKNGRDSLVDVLEGTGTRIVTASTCQTTSETMTLSGVIRLNSAAANKSGITGFPDGIAFDVDRRLVRRSVRTR